MAGHLPVIWSKMPPSAKWVAWALVQPPKTSSMVNRPSLGNLSARTRRQSVGALIGNRAWTPGRLGLGTNWDSRTNALSARVSKSGGVVWLGLAVLADVSGEEVENYLLSNDLVKASEAPAGAPTNAGCSDDDHAKMATKTVRFF